MSRLNSPFILVGLIILPVVGLALYAGLDAEKAGTLILFISVGLYGLKYYISRAQLHYRAGDRLNMLVALAIAILISAILYKYVAEPVFLATVKKFVDTAQNLGK